MTQWIVAEKGLQNIVVDQTALSLVEGQQGILIYRGYHIDEMAKCSFEEVCHLFLCGSLPSSAELDRFDSALKSERIVDSRVLEYIAAAAKADVPMAILRTAVSMLSAKMNLADASNAEALRKNAIALIAKTTTLAAAIARAKKGQPAVQPDPALSHAANFLYMSRGERVDEVVAKTLDTALVLHIDHGFNASTFTARATASTLTDMVSAVLAGIGSLKGPLHGGANTAVMNMLLEIGEPDNVDSFLEKALAEKRKIPGFGHRVYKTLDPRAKHLKQMSEAWGKRVGEVKWFTMSQRLEELMLEKKKLNANVDFYSASTYYAMGIPPDMYTVIFAIARMAGWSAHIMEQLGNNRLIRPEAEYTGPKDLKWVPIEER
ncbi:MAG: citrate synthase [Deltaproteobacteria bacterium]|nr:citrate synthase [Deltaproteobacteria bacterium]